MLLILQKAAETAEYIEVNMAHRVTNYMEIQRDEIQALRSIYMEDFEEEEIKKGAWNVRDELSKFECFCMLELVQLLNKCAFVRWDLMPHCTAFVQFE